MPLHTTSDPGIRAAHIAEHEAKQVYLQSHDFGEFLETFVSTYAEAVTELQPLAYRGD